MTPAPILAATGHRPNRLGLDAYSPATSRKLHRLATGSLVLIRPSLVISGMALGWDQAVAHAAIDLGIPVQAAIPHDGQDSRWPAASRNRYRAILKRCAEITVVTPGPYAAWKMRARDHFMADRCDVLLTLWDGSPDSGTGQTVRYAEELRPAPEVVHLWLQWLELAG